MVSSAGASSFKCTSSPPYNKQLVKGPTHQPYCRMVLKMTSPKGVTTSTASRLIWQSASLIYASPALCLMAPKYLVNPSKIVVSKSQFTRSLFIHDSMARCSRNTLPTSDTAQISVLANQPRDFPGFDCISRRFHAIFRGLTPFTGVFTTFPGKLPHFQGVFPHFEWFLKLLITVHSRGTQ